jgi:hypothetical protein
MQRGWRRLLMKNEMSPPVSEATTMIFHRQNPESTDGRKKRQALLRKICKEEKKEPKMPERQKA